MNPTRLSERKEKSIPIAGVILACLFTVDTLFTNLTDIIQTCGGAVYSFYCAGFALLVFLHLFPGLILIPALLIIFIVQAVRFRKNQKYARNCAFSVLWCFLIVLIGFLIRSISPAIENTITNVKIWTYESTVDKIHNGKQIEKYADMTGGAKSNEDVAFFQYSTGENERDNHTFYTTEYYILYSEDSVCDVERIKKRARELRLYSCDKIEMQQIKENWYRLEVTYQLRP